MVNFFDVGIFVKNIRRLKMNLVSYPHEDATFGLNLCQPNHIEHALLPVQIERRYHGELVDATRSDVSFEFV